MPRYAYQARDRSLQTVRGTIEADTETAAISRLSGRGVFPLTIAEVPEAEAQAAAQAASPARAAGRGVPAQALASMSRQLADLLGGGLPLLGALTLLAQQTEQARLRQALETVAGAVRDGRAFSDALADHPDVFAPLYTSMIRAGEIGGGLDAVLGRLADLLEHEAELRGRVAMALVYPAVVLGLGCVTIIVLLTYVVPKLSTLFLETDQLLPLPTRMLLAISGSLTRGWWLWLLGVGAAVAVVRQASTSAAGRVWRDRMLLRVGFVESLVRRIHIGRLARNLGVMLSQGVPMLQALEVSGATIGNTVIRQAVAGARQAVQDGATLSDALRASGQFPAFVCNLVAVGEESGRLDVALGKIASSYERETDRTLQALTTVLEPALIVVVGLVVMFIVIAMLLPIFQIGLVAQ